MCAREFHRDQTFCFHRPGSGEWHERVHALFRAGLHRCPRGADTLAGFQCATAHHAHPRRTRSAPQTHRGDADYTVALCKGPARRIRSPGPYRGSRSAIGSIGSEAAVADRTRVMTCDAKRDGDSARLSSRKGRAERARRHAADAAVIKALQTAGARSLRAIAAEFNARGVPTATGIGKWEATQVRRVMARLKMPPA
jgi:hypothetical protein